MTQDILMIEGCVFLRNNALRMNFWGIHSIQIETLANF
jgi:hypothetical protein